MIQLNIIETLISILQSSALDLHQDMIRKYTRLRTFIRIKALNISINYQKNNEICRKLKKLSHNI
uniref:Uncharacterized protein n=1 Tax=Lepeophtheirus salmonis TaxID=72036 RepID=A0A0K2UY83_LEPSM